MTDVIAEGFVLKMFRGDAASWRLQLRFPDPVTGELMPQDITGLTFRFTAKRRLSLADGDPGVIIRTSSSTPGITPENAPQGIFVLELDPADTSGLPGREVSYVCDVQVTDGQGRPKTPMKGRLVVSPDVSITVP